MIEALLQHLHTEISQTDALALAWLQPDAPLTDSTPTLRLLRLVPAAASSAVPRLHGPYLLDEQQASPVDLRERMSRPWLAIDWVAPLQKARILYDVQDSFAQLQAEARAFQWAPLQPAADAWASAILRQQATQVQCLLAALDGGHLPAAQSAAQQLLTSLSRALLVQRGLLLDSAAGSDFVLLADPHYSSMAWAQAFQQLAGFVVADPEQRARAALQLYYESASLLRHTCSDTDFQFIVRVLRWIQNSPYHDASSIQST